MDAATFWGISTANSHSFSFTVKINGHAFPPHISETGFCMDFLWFAWEQHKKCASTHGFLEGTLVSITAYIITFFTHTHLSFCPERERKKKRVFGWLHTCHKAYRSCNCHPCYSNDPPCTCRQCWSMENISPSSPCLLLQGDKAQIRLFVCPSIQASRSIMLPTENSPTSGIRDFD